MLKAVQNSQNLGSITQHSLSAALLLHLYLNLFSVLQTYPLCICIQFTYLYRHNDTLWIHSVCSKLTRFVYVSSPSIDTCTMILLVLRNYPMCICIQFIYWYMHNDTPWIYSVCFKLTHCACVSSPAIDTCTMILLESTPCVSNLPTVHMYPFHLLIHAQWYSFNLLSVLQTYPLCMCLQSIYWYMHNDSPWIHSVCGKRPHYDKAGCSNDTHHYLWEHTAIQYQAQYDYWISLFAHQVPQVGIEPLFPLTLSHNSVFMLVS